MMDSTKAHRPGTNAVRAPLVGLAMGLAAVLGLSGCEAASEPAPDVSALPYYADASFTPHWYPDDASVPDGFHAIPPFTLTDQRGETVTEADFAGTFTIANFFFTSCPGICPMTMANMARLQAEFADDDTVRLLSHSVTPETDDVAALEAFAEQMEVVAGTWTLATGDRAHIYELGKRYYFADEDLGQATGDEAEADDFLHTESVYLLDQNRRIRGLYNGMNTASVTQLIADVRALQAQG